jgi:cyanophycinase
VNTNGMSKHVVSPTMAERIHKGPVMPIGGAEERSPGGGILRTFVDLAKKPEARIVVVPTASSEPDTGEDYVEVFARMGASAEIARIASREDANSDEMVKLLEDASGIFITGGDQARLSTLMVGTLGAETIQRCNKEGTVVAGTSAGASILGAHMMSNGVSEAPPHKGMVEIVAGFGLLDDLIVDQHFSTRGRIGRLLVTFAANPGLIALGIDENTALVIQGDGSAKVIGKNSVTVLDSRNVYSNYHDCADGDILTITGAAIHVMAPGRVFDLNRREVLFLKQEQTAVRAG